MIRVNYINNIAWLVRIVKSIHYIMQNSRTPTCTHRWYCQNFLWQRYT